MTTYNKSQEILCKLDCLHLKRDWTTSYRRHILRPVTSVPPLCLDDIDGDAIKVSASIDTEARNKMLTESLTQVHTYG